MLTYVFKYNTPCNLYRICPSRYLCVVFLCAWLYYIFWYHVYPDYIPSFGAEVALVVTSFPVGVTPIMLHLLLLESHRLWYIFF